MKIKRIFALTGITIIGFSLGFSAVLLARHHSIPGVDKPYDPANYWSPTSISWADSAPSTYALRDLANQGGQVYDLTRHLKSILYGDNFEQILNQAISFTQKQQENMTPMSEGTISKTLDMLNVLSNRHAELQYDAQVDTTGGGIFMEPATSEADLGRSEEDFPLDQQERWLARTYALIAQASNDKANDTEAILAATDYALDLLNNAESEMQVNQALGILEAIKTQVEAQTSDMAADRINLKALKEMKEQSDYQRRNAHTNRTLPHFTDPYDDSINETLEKGGYQKSVSNGMPDFE